MKEQNPKANLQYLCAGVMKQQNKGTDIEFGGGNRDDVVTAFSATEAAAGVFHFRYGQEELFDNIGNFVHLIEGSAGSGGGGDEHAFLGEAREKIFAHARVEKERSDEEHGNESEQEEWLAKSKTEQSVFEEVF